MAITKITYENKEAIQNDASVANKSKVTDADMNEIKRVVNNNADEVTTMQGNIENLQSGQGTADADITSLKNRVSILETDNTQNKSDITTLKTDNETNKSDIAELQEQFSNFENYDDTEIKEDISDLQEEQQTQNKNIENLQTNDSKQDLLISKLKNVALNAKTEEAKSLHIKDANKFGSLEVLGNHEQEAREGYSIWDYLSVARSSADGLTIEKDLEEGYITVNGTPNSNYVNLCTQEDITDMLEDGQTYTLWQEKYADSNTKGIYLQVTETTSNGNKNYFSRDNAVNFTVNKQNATYQIGLQTGTIADTGILTNYKNRYMLYKGTDTKTYELPGATPSINYPSKIVCLGSNKQLLNIFSNRNAGDIVTSKGIKFTVNEDGTVTANGTATGLAQISFMPNATFRAGTYTIKDATAYIQSEDFNGWFNGLISAQTVTINTDFTITNTYVQVQSGETVNNKIFYPKIEEGTEETSYSPYRTR